MHDNWLHPQDARILIVDDTLDMVHLLQALLRSVGYKNLICTTDPREVVQLYRDSKPDLILLDLMMPYLDGFEVMARLRPLAAHESFMPILVLTGDVATATRQRALQEGARDFLAKPFDDLEVMLRIKNLLETRFLHQQLHHYNQRLLEVQEVERRHIAHELHDEIGQALTAVKINLQAAQRLSNGCTFRSHLEEGINIVERALTQVRDLSLDLRPAMLDDFGLVETLAWYVDRRGQTSGISTRFTAHTSDKRFPAPVETACFRIAQEAMTNAIRHSHASQIEIELQQHDNELELIFRDNGVGFEIKAVRQRMMHGTSLGLLSMEERARLIHGWLEIDSRTDAGTRIRGHFPLSPSPLSSSPVPVQPALQGPERGGGI